MAGGRVAERIVGHAADHHAVMAEAGEADRDIGLGAADMDVEAAGLQQQFAPRRGQPQQQFAKANDASHRRTLPVMARAGNRAGA